MLLLSLTYGLNAQIIDSKKDEPFVGVQSKTTEPKKIPGEESPEFPGGNIEMQKFIEKNIKYPASAKEKNVEGKCFLKFLVNVDGSLTDVHILRGIPVCKECDEEALRVVKTMPNWKPAKSKNKEVASNFSVAVTFKIID